MTKIATIALALSLAATTAFAQGTPPANSVASTNGAPRVQIVTGAGSTGVLIGLISLIVLAGLAGGGNNGGGDTSSSSSGSGASTTQY